MSETINIDPSIAADLNIDPIYADETVIFTWTAEDELPNDDFEFTLYNSEKKNTSQIVENVVAITGKEMTWTIAPEAQSIEPRKHYFEIFNKTELRLAYKGHINILP